MERRQREEVVTNQVLRERGMSQRAIARQLGVDEKAVRYRLRRLAEGRADGRSEKPFRAEPWAGSIAHWMATQSERGIDLRVLTEWLVTEHGYAGSYKAIRRYVRAKYLEGRTNSVPFVWAERTVELRGCARTVQVWAEGRLVTEHPRTTRERILLDPRHDEDPGMERNDAPVPLGRMRRKLQEIRAMVPARREWFRSCWRSLRV